MYVRVCEDKGQGRIQSGLRQASLTSGRPPKAAGTPNGGGGGGDRPLPESLLPDGGTVLPPTTILDGLPAV